MSEKSDAIRNTISEIYSTPEDMQVKGFQY